MKKLLAIVLFCSMAIAFAVTYPVAGLGNLVQYNGAWSRTTQYNIKAIKGTYYNATPVVESGNISYVLNNESTPVLGESPAANPQAWDVLN
jgi:hypothetical protein